jgi:hypothetical protein
MLPQFIPIHSLGPLEDFVDFLNRWLDADPHPHKLKNQIKNASLTFEATRRNGHKSWPVSDGMIPSWGRLTHEKNATREIILTSHASE